MLFGQNELASHIDALPELKSRMFPSALAALAYEETRDLISYRLTVAGAARNPFSEEAIREVYRLSLGLPREVCKLCDMALVAGCAAKTSVVAPALIEAAAESLRIQAQEVSDA